MNLKDQVALITGGGTGVGRATALLFAEHGANVAINYRHSKSDAEKTSSDVQQFGHKAAAFQADVADETAVATMVKNVVDQFGRLDILVNNAAMTHMVPYRDLDEMTSQRWDEILGVNLKGAFFVSREAIRVMRKQGSGQIINVSSISGFTGQGSCIAYATSKAALINMTRGMANSEAPTIRINAVAPGVIETRWIEGWEKFTDPHRDATPLKRHAQPEDVANAIFGLAINPFITGQAIVVDGGRTLGTT